MGESPSIPHEDTIVLIPLQFKIDQAGLISGTVGSGTWAAGQMIANNNSWTTTIPSTVPSGNYLIRFETIALHSMPAVRLLTNLHKNQF